MFKIVCPANIGTIFKIMMHLAAFEVIPYIEENIRIVFGLDVTEPFSSNFSKVGLDSMWLIVNLGSVSVFIFTIFVLIMLVSLMRMCSKCRIVGKIVNYLSQFLFWSAVIQLITQEYVLLSLCCMLNIMHLEWNKWSSFLSSSLALFVMGLLLIYPFKLIYVFKRYFD